MTQNIIQYLKAVTACEETASRLEMNEELLIITDVARDNCGAMSRLDEADDIKKANEKLLHYIDSIRDKQVTVTPAQISKELGMSQDFIEAALIANGFQED